MRFSGWLAPLAAFFSAAVCAADNPFVGSWKFDAARSKLVAETVQYRDLGDGRMHFSNGATLDYDFALDGKDYETTGNRTIAWKPLSAGDWQVTIKIAGKTTETSQRTLSADGKTLAVLADGALPMARLTSTRSITHASEAAAVWRAPGAIRKRTPATCPTAT